MNPMNPCAALHALLYGVELYNCVTLYSICTDLMVIDFNVSVELSHSEEIVAGVPDFINVERRSDVVWVDVVEPIIKRRFGLDFDVESVKEARLSHGLPDTKGIARAYNRVQDFPVAAGLAGFVASEPAHQLYTENIGK